MGMSLTADRHLLEACRTIFKTAGEIIISFFDFLKLQNRLVNSLTEASPLLREAVIQPISVFVTKAIGLQAVVMRWV